MYKNDIAEGSSLWLGTEVLGWRLKRIIMIINDTRNSLLLFIRPKLGFSLQLYSDVMIQNYIVCYLPRIVCNQILIGTLHLCLCFCCTITKMLGTEHNAAHHVWYWRNENPLPTPVTTPMKDYIYIYIYIYTYSVLWIMWYDIKSCLYGSTEDNKKLVTQGKLSI